MRRRWSSGMGLRFAVALMTLVSGCGKQRDVGEAMRSGALPRFGSRRLTEAEMRYGIAPTRNSQVEYQDNVVIVEGGAEAVRSLSADALTWTIDAHAPHAKELAPGKIIFLTDRAAGRVLGVQEDGDDLRVTIGPAALTDIIKRADLSYDQPLDVESMISYTAPDFPGTVVTPEPSSAAESAPEVKPASFSFFQANGSPGQPAPPAQPSLGPPREFDLHDFKITPFCCGGLGMGVKYDHDGVLIKARTVLWLHTPTVHFDLKIEDGKVIRAKLVLTGVGGLTMEFEAGSTAGVNGNIDSQLWIPSEIRLPIYGLPVPVAVAFHEGFLIKTAFSSKNSTVHAVADYGFKGSIEVGYENGSWVAKAPTELTVKQSLVNSIGGAALGATGLVMGFQGRVIVGIGAFGFMTGPYLGYTASIGIVRGPDVAGLALGMPGCRGAYLDRAIAMGIGYSIPEAVTRAVNVFLKALNLKQIDSVGGTKPFWQWMPKMKAAIPNNCTG